MKRRILLTALGAFAGVSTFTSSGLLIGAAIGFAAALFLEMREEIETLSDRVLDLETRGTAAPVSATADIPVDEVSPEAMPEEFVPTEPVAKPVELRDPISAHDPPPEFDAEPAADPRPVPPPVVEREPAEPSLVAQAWTLLTGGNPLARIGIAMLFVGLVFLIGYATEQGYLSIEIRLLATAAAGLALVVAGWLLRRRAEVYAVTLQGGGVAVMYLTVFAAFQLYDVLPPAPAFVLLAAIAAFSAVLAIVQNAPVLAVVGVLGGFGAPVLASTGQGDHVLLFSYYAVLNAGVFAIAYVKSWRSLYLVGFVCTFVIGGLWGGLNYEPALFASTEPFLLLFFALYFAIPVLATRRRAPRLNAPIDGSLVFGLPVAAFALQAVLVEPFEFGRAWSAFALALIYLGTATALARSERPETRPLVEAFFAIGLTFATLTIPFALDAVWSGALWLLEGAALVWTGVRQRRLWLRISGLGLQLVAVFLLVGEDALAFDAVPLGVRLSGWLAALTLGASAYWLHASDGVRPWERRLSPVVLLLGVYLWSASGLTFFADRIPDDSVASVLLTFFAVSVWGFVELARSLRWPALGATALPLGLGAGYLLLPFFLFFHEHPLAHGGWLAWPLAFVLLGVVLWRREGATLPRRLGVAHAAALWLFALVATREVAWLLDRWTDGGAGWAEAGVGVVLAALVLAVMRPPDVLARWMASHRTAYLRIGAGGLAVALLGWSILTDLYSAGDPSPLPYLPLLNPFDLAHIASLLVLALYVRVLIRAERTTPATASLLYSALSLGVFVAVSGFVARAVHHLAAVPFDPDILFASTLFQTALSITWALLAMAVMIAATRLRLRTPWFVGAALLALVGVKLLVVDLSNAGTLARIVSFVGVGLLVLLIGYFSPAPPRRDEPEDVEPEPMVLS
ncbi:MAG: DUF2339 domain-containing protein [Rhodothermales bacterium]